MEDRKPLSLAQRLMAKGIKKSHAYQLTKSPPSVPTAVRVFQKTGIKLGPIADATDDEIAVLERFRFDREDGGALATGPAE